MRVMEGVGEMGVLALRVNVSAPEGAPATLDASEVEDLRDELNDWLQERGR